MFKYNTLDDFDFKNKVVGVRVDINSPIIKGKVELNERIIAHSKTIAELSDKGAKVIVLGHQGRKGKDDCLSLSNHQKLLEKETKKKIKFIAEIYSKNVEAEIAKLKSGQILLLENLRFSDDENESEVEKKNNLIVKLEKSFNYYCIDAFSVAHRAQTSIVGFKNIPLLAGRVMQKELEGLNQIAEVKRPSVYMLGGAKPDDLIDILEINFKRGLVDYAILSGVIGEICLMVKGYDLGCKKKFLEERGYLGSYDRIKKLVESYDKKLVLPKDLAIFNGKKRIEIKIADLKKAENKKLLSEFVIQDIGKETVAYFSEYIDKAGSIYLKGPSGNFEDKNFEYGTKNLIAKLSKSKAFTYLGGGHSVTAVSMYSDLKKFGYISLAGGALVEFLSGKELPGVVVLEKSCKKIIAEKEGFVVVGSNTLDIDIKSPIGISNFHLGDKVKVEDDFEQTIGGGGINVSICLSRLGGQVSYLGKISSENENKIAEVLNKDGVSLVPSKISKEPCAKSIIIDTPDNDRIIFTYRGQNPLLINSDFNNSDLVGNYLYFSSLAGQSFKTQIEIAKNFKAKKKDSKICLNLSFNIIRQEKNLDLLIKYCDILVLNYEEAQEYSKKEKLSDCLKEIKKNCEVVVITDGSHGAYAYDGKKEYFVPSVKPKKVIDTTGAGDSFAGTFFYFYVRSKDIKHSMEMAAKNSSSVVGTKGAHEGLLTCEKLSK